MEVKLVGEVRSRRSFASIQFMHDEKEIDRYMAEQEKGNPTIDNSNVKDSFLIAQFERIGIISNNEFLQARFKPQTTATATFIDQSQRAFNIKFFQDSISGNIHFIISSPKCSIEIDTKASALQDLDYAFLDIIPGGNKELVFLDDYHIMNGDNFDLKVYEIKTR